MKIWQVQHVREIVDDREDVKQIGLFTSEAEAVAAVNQVRVEPGFRQHPDGFVISSVLINHVGWEQGFTTLEANDVERPDVDAYGRSRLWYAAHDGDIAEAARVIGEDPSWVNRADDSGWTPTHAAVTGGYAKVVSLLIEGGANVNATDRNGDGPLWEAARLACFSSGNQERVDIVRLLVAAGADPNHMDSFNQSPNLGVELTGSSTDESVSIRRRSQ